MILIFPKGDFTIADLELENRELDSRSVRMVLAEAISKGDLEVINEGERPFLYRRIK
jgi:hypothetical protein